MSRRQPPAPRDPRMERPREPEQGATLLMIPQIASDPVQVVNLGGPRARGWRWVTTGLATAVVLLGVALSLTWPRASAYSSMVEENLALKGSLESLESKMTEIDRILLRMRLYDAQLESLGGAEGDHGPLPDDLVEGQSVQIPGSGGRSYTVKLLGGVYSCSCPAWRNQSMAIDLRTCKHLRKLRGDEAERARLDRELPQRAIEATEAPALLLAMSFDASSHDPTGWWVSEKLDGVRALWDGQRFVSRLGNAYLAPDWFTASLPDTPLDGELFAGRGKFQQAVSVARQIDAGERWRDLRFVIFDGPALPGGFEERLSQLRALVPEGGWEHAEILPHAPCAGAEALEAEMDRVEALGGEGLMLREPGSAYVQGRSATLLKVKRFVDAEAIVVGHVAGAGRHKGRLGAVRVELPDGTAFKVGTGFSDAQREDPPPIGAVIAFRYQELTDAGVPRFPSFQGVRHDVDWAQRVAEAQRTEPS